MMTMRDAVILALNASRDHVIQGRTRLSKRIYLASAMSCIDLLYRPSYFGPYSRECMAELDSLVEWGFVDETIEQDDNGTRVYSYRLSNDGEMMICQSSKLLCEDVSSEEIKFKKFLDAITAIDNDDKTLSLAVKIHWILQKKVFMGHGLINITNDPEVEILDLHISNAERDAALHMLEDLHLV
jgi:uncharacterized protein YwgA